MKAFFLVILSFGTIYCQTDWKRWDTSQVSYQLPEKQHRNYYLDENSIGSLVISSVRNTYWFFISDLDGDNCPFNPSCSLFFVDAVRKTNIFQGVLIFADRFTRDTNLFKSRKQYKFQSYGKIIDPVDNYLLKKSLISSIK